MTSQTLPFINISPFLTATPAPGALDRTTTAISAACRTHGFFYLTDHGVSPALTSRVLALARTFFTQVPAAEKELLARQDAGKGVGDGARGYQVIGSNVTLGRRDWHEALDWYRPVREGDGLVGAEIEGFLDRCGREEREGNSNARAPPFRLLQGINLWPDTPSEFKDVYEMYVEQMLGLGTAVVRAMGYALGLNDPETFVKATRESFWVMRAIGYPPLPLSADGSNGEVDGVSCGAHTDYGCLTLLLADDTKGALQVQARGEPERWIDADPVPGAFVVNIGDMMERWSNGLWKSTRHQVVHRGDGFRVSVPFFFEPDFEAVVKPLRECVQQTGGRELWREIKYGEHLVGKVSGNFYGG